ncbi:MAG TPA: hypothetical protein VFN37_09545 [Candidatus Baltobacteraceae bacterium]|nr:hypothetical protein [Candidatus Baltobacteraceae bacterium]
MIRVRVPLDLHAVSSNRSGAFALATPIRVRDLLSLAVREAIGTRAPDDKFARSLRTTLLGLSSGRFTVDINGRHFSNADEVVVCGDTADVRFYIPARNPVPQTELA